MMMIHLFIENSVVRDTLDALVDDVNATTDILRKRINAPMEVIILVFLPIVTLEVI